MASAFCAARWPSTNQQLQIRPNAIEAAQKADAIVYVLLCADRGFYGVSGWDTLA